jgi:hypothetical protein
VLISDADALFAAEHNGFRDLDLRGTAVPGPSTRLLLVTGLAAAASAVARGGRGTARAKEVSKRARTARWRIDITSAWRSWP